MLAPRWRWCRVIRLVHRWRFRADGVTELGAYALRRDRACGVVSGDATLSAQNGGVKQRHSLDAAAARIDQSAASRSSTSPCTASMWMYDARLSIVASAASAPAFASSAYSSRTVRRPSIPPMNVTISAGHGRRTSNGTLVDSTAVRMTQPDPSRA